MPEGLGTEIGAEVKLEMNHVELTDKMTEAIIDRSCESTTMPPDLAEWCSN